MLRGIKHGRGLLLDVTSPGSSGRSEGDARAVAMVRGEGGDAEDFEAEAFGARASGGPRVLDMDVAAVKAEHGLPEHAAGITVFFGNGLKLCWQQLICWKRERCLGAQHP